MTTAWPPAETLRPPDPLAIPPGMVLNAASVAMFVIALWRGSERTGDPGSVLLIAAGWFFILLAWVFRFVAGASSGTVSSASVFRWALAPSLFVIVGVLVFGGYALGVRFAMSEGALDAAADAVLAGDTDQSGWIGLYPIDHVSVDGRTVRFEVSSQLPLVRDAPTGFDDSSTVWYEPIDDRWSIEMDFSFID